MRGGGASTPPFRRKIGREGDDRSKIESQVEGWKDEENEEDLETS